jgi:hypothetical protein
MHEMFAGGRRGARTRNSKLRARRWELDPIRRDAYHLAYNHRDKSEAEITERLKVLLGEDVTQQTIKQGEWPFLFCNEQTIVKIREVYDELDLEYTGYNKQGLQARVRYMNMKEPAERPPLRFNKGVFSDWSIEKLKPFELWVIRYQDSYIGLYATENAAARVMLHIREHKARAFLSAEAREAEPPQIYLGTLQKAKHKLNYPLAEPYEQIYVKRGDSPRIKIKTQNVSGYTSTFDSDFIALKHKEALLCAGDLSPYIEVERP